MICGRFDSSRRYDGASFTASRIAFFFSYSRININLVGIDSGTSNWLLDWAIQRFDTRLLNQSINPLEDVDASSSSSCRWYFFSWWCLSSFYRLPLIQPFLPNTILPSSSSLSCTQCCPCFDPNSLYCSCRCRYSCLLVLWFLSPWHTRRLLVRVAASTKRTLYRFCDHFFLTSPLLDTTSLRYSL